MDAMGKLERLINKIKGKSSRNIAHQLALGEYVRQEASENLSYDIVHDDKDAIGDKITDELCPRCETIDFDYIFKHKLTRHMDERDFLEREIWKALPLPWINPSTKKSHSKDGAVATVPHCPFCRLIFCLPPALLNSPGYRNRDTVVVSLDLREAYGQVGKETKWEIVPRIRFNEWQVEGYNNEYIHRISEPSDMSSGLMCGRRVGPLVDIGVLKKWLSLCEKTHDACRKLEDSNNTVKFSIRLIDVIQECIVIVEDSCEYAALSYVWGKCSYKILRFR